jgi:exonuclease III
VALIRDYFLSHVGATKEANWDKEGKVLATKLRCRLVVINGYWVNGTENPDRDLETGVVIGNRHDRKRVFHQMLEKCLSHQKRGWYVVLVGDMNIALGTLDGHPGLWLGQAHAANRADFNAKFFLTDTGFRAIDAFRHRHGETRKYTYYGRNTEWASSRDRVDLVIVSRPLGALPGVLAECDLLNLPEERGHSDHVPLYVTLDLKGLDESPHNGVYVNYCS